MSELLKDTFFTARADYRPCLWDSHAPFQQQSHSGPCRSQKLCSGQWTSSRLEYSSTPAARWAQESCSCQCQGKWKSALEYRHIMKLCFPGHSVLILSPTWLLSCQMWSYWSAHWASGAKDHLSVHSVGLSQWQWPLYCQYVWVAQHQPASQGYTSVFNCSPANLWRSPFPPWSNCYQVMPKSGRKVKTNPREAKGNTCPESQKTSCLCRQILRDYGGAFWRWRGCNGRGRRIHPWRWGLDSNKPAMKEVFANRVNLWLIDLYYKIWSILIIIPSIFSSFLWFICE